MMRSGAAGAMSGIVSVFAGHGAVMLMPRMRMPVECARRDAVRAELQADQTALMRGLGRHHFQRDAAGRHAIQHERLLIARPLRENRERRFGTRVREVVAGRGLFAQPDLSVRRDRDRVQQRARANVIEPRAPRMRQRQNARFHRSGLLHAERHYARLIVFQTQRVRTCRVDVAAARFARAHRPPPRRISDDFAGALSVACGAENVQHFVGVFLARRGCGDARVGELRSRRRIFHRDDEVRVGQRDVEGGVRRGAFRRAMCELVAAVAQLDADRRVGLIAQQHFVATIGVGGGEDRRPALIETELRADRLSAFRDATKKRKRARSESCVRATVVRHARCAAGCAEGWMRAAQPVGAGLEAREGRGLVVRQRARGVAARVGLFGAMEQINRQCRSGE